MGLGHQVAVDLRGAAIDRRDRRVPEVRFDPTAEVGIRILAGEEAVGAHQSA